METEIQEVVFALMLSVFSDRLGNASEFTSVLNLKWFRNVTHWPKESVTETSPPIWYSVRLLNKNHIIENILEEQIKTTDICQDSKARLLIFLVKSAQFQESWETAEV